MAKRVASYDIAELPGKDKWTEIERTIMGYSVENGRVVREVAEYRVVKKYMPLEVEDGLKMVPVELSRKFLRRYVETVAVSDSESSSTDYEPLNPPRMEGEKRIPVSGIRRSCFYC